MGHRFGIFLILFAASAVRAQIPPTTNSALPTTADIYALIDTSQYRPALQDAVRILNLKGPVAAPYNRAEIYLLRAECQLQLHQNDPALQALNAAAQEARTALARELSDAAANPAPASAPASAPATVSPNSDFAAKAWALAALVAKSPAMHYTPKAQDGPLPLKPIDILDRTTRPLAYHALFNDTLPEARNRVHATANVTSVTPILELAKSVAALRAMELAGTGDGANSRLLGSALADRASALLSSGLQDMHHTADGIAHSANVVFYTPMEEGNIVSGNHMLVQVPHRRGLSNDDIAHLRNLQQTCAQIISACVDLDLALENPDSLKQLALDANDLGQQINRVLSDDYSRVP